MSDPFDPNNPSPPAPPGPPPPVPPASSGAQPLSADSFDSASDPLASSPAAAELPPLSGQAGAAPDAFVPEAHVPEAQVGGGGFAGGGGQLGDDPYGSPAVLGALGSDKESLRAMKKATSPIMKLMAGLTVLTVVGLIIAAIFSWRAEEDEKARYEEISKIEGKEETLAALRAFLPEASDEPIKNVSSKIWVFIAMHRPYQC